MQAIKVAALSVCASGVAWQAAALQGGAGGGTGLGEGPLGGYSVQVNGTREFRIGSVASPIVQSNDFGTASAVPALGDWEWSSFDRLDSSLSRTSSMFDAEIRSTHDRLSGRLEARSSALTQFQEEPSESPSSRAFQELQVVAEPLDVLADVLVTIDVDTSLSGFGNSRVSWNTFSDEFSDRGIVFPGNEEDGSFQMLYENVNVSFFELQLRVTSDALTDAPVLNADSFVNVDWSVEIAPVPAPGSIAFVGVAACAASVRRRAR